MKLSIIIPTTNRKEQLRKCLTSIYEQTYKNFSVIVVLNGSTDGTEEMILKEFSQVELLKFEEMIGSAGGYKNGLETAFKKGFDWFWLMDDDAWADKTALDYLIKVSDLDTSKVFTSVGLDTTDHKNLSWHNYSPSKKMFKTYQDLGIEKKIELFGLGYVGLFFSREVIKKIGYPNEKLFTWADDVDYAIRMKIARFKLFYVRESIVFHPNPTKHFKLFFKDVWVILGPPWKEYYILRNHVYIWLKYENKFKILFFRLPKQFILYILIILLFEDKKLKRFYYYLLAFRDGVTGKLGLTINPNNN